MLISIKKRWEIVFLSKHRRGPNPYNSFIAKEFDCSIPTVKRWLKRYEETGDVIDNPKTGREKWTDQKINDEIIQHSKEHPEFSSALAKITQQLKRKNKSYLYYIIKS